MTIQLGKHLEQFMLCYFVQTYDHVHGSFENAFLAFLSDYSEYRAEILGEIEALLESDKTVAAEDVDQEYYQKWSNRFDTVLFTENLKQMQALVWRKR